MIVETFIMNILSNIIVCELKSSPVVLRFTSVECELLLLPYHPGTVYYKCYDNYYQFDT
jgi:hypothetical protein